MPAKYSENAVSKSAIRGLFFTYTG